MTINKNNLLAIISNRSSIFSNEHKPNIKIKSLLFKYYSGIETYNIVINENNIYQLAYIIKCISSSFGGIYISNLYIPDIIELENILISILDIPIMSDNLNSTAIITSAALINAIELIHKDINQIKIVINGAGVFIYSANIYLKLGVKKQNIFMYDSKGMICKSRRDLNI